MATDDNGLTRTLAALEIAGLIRPASAGADGEYIFRHVLSQEAAYHSLLKQDRRRLHLAVGTSLERLGAHQAEGVAPILAHHFLEAGEETRALHYLAIAASEATRTFANAEAIMLYDRALGLSARSQQPLSAHADLVLKRGRLLEIRGDYVGALRCYAELEQLAKDDDAVRLRALMASTIVHSAPTSQYHSERGAAYAERVIALARQLGDRAAEAQALWLHMLRCKFIPDMRRAMEYGDRAIVIARELGLNELLAYALNDIFAVYVTLGRIGDGTLALVEAERLWRALDNKPLLVDTLTNIGEMHFFAADFERAEPPIHEARQIAESIGSVWGQSYSMTMLGYVRTEQCRFGEAIPLLETGIERGKEAGFALASILVGAMLANIYLELGYLDRALDLARIGMRVAEESVPGWRGLPSTTIALAMVRQGDLAEAAHYVDIARTVASPYDLSSLYLGLSTAELCMRRGDYEGVLVEVKEALATHAHIGIPLFGPRVQAYAGEALIHLGRLDEAARVLQDAIDKAQARHTPRCLWRSYALLAKCERLRGNVPQSRAAQKAARTEIAFILDHLGDDSQRATFTRQPEIQAILDPASDAAID